MRPVWDGWTAEATEEAVRRWKIGESCGMIAKAIGCSRNAAIGRLHRLGYRHNERIDHLVLAYPAWRSSPSVSLPMGGARTPKAKAAPKPSKPVQRPPEPQQSPNPVALEDLRRSHCRWPLWSDHDRPTVALFCGCEAVSGSPYCAVHDAVSRRAEQVSGSRYVRSTVRVADYIAAKGSGFVAREFDR